MTVKNILTDGLTAGDILVVVTLAVKGVFDAAFWPAISNGLTTYECPNNLFNLARSYFSQRSAYLSNTKYRILREVRLSAHKAHVAVRVSGTHNITKYETSTSLGVQQ